MSGAVSHINGHRAPADPVQDAIASVEHYLFRGTATVACSLVLKDGHSCISLTTHDPASGDMDIQTLTNRARATSEAMVVEYLNAQRSSNGNGTH